MKASIVKYFICYLVEKEHRFVFDTCYFAYEDPKYKSLNIIQRSRKWVFNNILYIIYPDYRQYLRWWHANKKSDYIRYSQYELSINKS
jgi:hypothetical protein